MQNEPHQAPASTRAPQRAMASASIVTRVFGIIRVEQFDDRATRLAQPIFRSGFVYDGENAVPTFLSGKRSGIAHDGRVQIPTMHPGERSNTDNHLFTGNHGFASVIHTE